MEFKLIKGFLGIHPKRLFMFLMRTFIFLVCTSLMALSPDGSFSQERVKINADKQVSVDEVFKLIKTQTKYSFLYPEYLFTNAPKVALKKGSITVGKLLQQSIPKGKFNIMLGIDNCITIKKKSQSQQKQISGTVTSKGGSPLPGVTILIKGTNKGLSTNFEGQYQITVPDAASVLVFSFLGYQTQEVLVGNQTVIHISLEEDITLLKEVVVVSTGYQEISRERATGAFESVNKKQLEKPASSISERLVGMVAGLQSTVNADGSIDFEIRGQSSLYADQQPLIVLDGFPVEDGFNTINPNDVESITVLKDAAAASIWGAKAGNGVIVITTKKAKKGKINVSISSFVRTSSKLDLDYVLGRATSTETIEYEQQGFDSSFFGSPFGGPPGDSQRELSPFSQAIVAMNEARLGRISNAQRDATLNRLSSLNNKSQIEKYLLQVPITKQYNINISGGNEKMANSLSLLFEDGQSFFQGDEAKKYLINYNNNVKLTSKLDFDFAAMMQYNDANNDSGRIVIGNPNRQSTPFPGQDMLNTIRTLAPWDMLVNDDGSLTDMSYLKYYRPNLDTYVPFDEFPYSDWSYNPIEEVRNRDLHTEQLNARVQAGLTYSFFDGLKLSSRIQYERFKTSVNNYFNDKTFDVREFVNETSGPEWQSGGTPSQLVPSGGILQQSEGTTTAYNFRNQLSFSRVFAEKHAIDFIAGSEISDRVSKFKKSPDAFGYNDKTLSNSPLLKDLDSSVLWDFSPSRFADFFYNFNLTPVYDFQENTIRLFSLYSNLNYTFDGRYSITGSYRTDASNIISDDPKFRYNPFWSVGLGWQIANEPFMESITWINKLTLRGTYGANGNIDRSTSYRPLINLLSTLDPVTQERQARISDFGNPTLRWEKTNTYNIGIDFSLLKNAFYGSVDIYNKKGNDLIVEQSISAVNGTDNQKFNNGKMLNKGFEIQLGATVPISENDVVWSGSLNFAHNDNKITSFFRNNYQSYDLWGGPTSSYVEGFDANTLWSFRYAGLVNTGTEDNPNLMPSLFGEDDVKLTFTNFPSGNAINYMENQGTLVAPTTVGMRNSFKIYDFDLSFIVTAKFGHVFRRQSFNYNPLISGNSMVNEKYSEVVNGDPSKIIPIPDQEFWYFFYDRFYPFMNYLTEDASHIRFQEVNLTYSLADAIVKNLGLNTFDIYGQANNLGVILWNDFGEDPEFPKESIRPQATFTFGIHLTF
ncbi:SusC/RagA family TonB-linked outer membrane protein [uncultured Polaribacter sp.]|uniref:SusC/RagA family TonB-linked outer membrane protein n=1 Tax=uncultured Polaribacter sp. TaxID=174711 RepID=UPI00260F5283|nr:SusC/RagA family TonB-linked outer membrane protein [uncultured Polaribacter sp.]